MLSSPREFVGSPPPQIGGNSYHYHHGITYAHVQDLTTPKPKKTLASRISNQFERLKRSSSADKSRDSRLINISQNEAGFSPHFRPRRTFYNVIPSHHRNGSMRSRRYYLHPPVSASVTPSWVNSPKEGGSAGGIPHFVHRPQCYDMDNANLAINGNVCLCESFDEGNGRLCRRCGLEPQASRAKVESWWRDWINSTSQNKEIIRRSQSEESVSTHNPYEAMRKQRLASPRYSNFANPEAEESSSDDSQDEEDKNRAYAEADLIYNSVRRRPPLIPNQNITQPPHQNITQPPMLKRSSSSVIRRSIILKTPMNLQKQNSISNSTKIYVNGGQEAGESAKESSEEDENSEQVENEKMKKLQIRNLKRLREKVKEEKLKNSSLKSNSKITAAVDQNNDYDADLSDLQNSPVKSNLRRASFSNTDDSKLMQLYNRRKRQQEAQLKSQFSVNDFKKLDVGKEVPKDEVNNSHLFNDTTRIRMISRPSIKDAFNTSNRLGRRGISQSFKEKLPIRPKEPPPPPPPQNKRLSRSASNGKLIYDIAESDEVNEAICILHTNSGGQSRPQKPPRSKRSQSFTPSSKQPQEEVSLVKVGQSSSASSLLSSESKENKDHIYEEIQSRPLPPIPKVSVVSVSSKLSSLKAQIDEEDVKSIFVGATKYEILNYLEDAKERGVDSVEAIEEAENETGGILADRNHANRVSQFSQSSGSSGSSTIIIHNNKDKWTTSVEIERNDSGLGSETGKSTGKRKQRIRDKLTNKNPGQDTAVICEDCDQPINEMGTLKSEENFESTTCSGCAKRRIERKEIITEIIETEIKYGRDLRIILEEFFRPMQVAGLLSQEQLSAIFLNVQELAEVNRQFTESLRDAIEISLDEGDEDLCTVKIGKIFKEAEPMLGAFKNYCTRQGASSALLATLEKERELLRIFLRVSQMENTILRRMNLSSFLMVPVQRVTKYPLLLSRLLKVTPSHHEDRSALQESRERIEHHLENMNQEARDTNSTRLWRRISMINVSSYRKMDSQLDVLGNTTWGIRKMALDVLQWTNKSREDVNFVLEGKLLFTQATESKNRPWNSKMAPVSGLLVTLGRNSLEPPSSLQDDGSLNFPVETGASEAALLLIKEKNNRYSMIRDPIFLGNCIICWEQDWDDSFEVHEFVAKESLIFKGEDASRTRQWFKALQFYGLSLGNWRKRRNGMSNIMIYGTSQSSTTSVAKSSSLGQLVDLH